MNREQLIEWYFRVPADRRFCDMTRQELAFVAWRAIAFVAFVGGLANWLAR